MGGAVRPQLGADNSAGSSPRLAGSGQRGNNLEGIGVINATFGVINATFIE